MRMGGMGIGEYINERKGGNGREKERSVGMKTSFREIEDIGIHSYAINEC